MKKLSGTTVIKSPTGLRMPLFVYALSISVSISVGSAVGMHKLNYPWWVWVIEALILLPITHKLSHSLVKIDSSGNCTITSNPRLISFSLIAATIIALLTITFALL